MIRDGQPGDRDQVAIPAEPEWWEGTVPFAADPEWGADNYVPAPYVIQIQGVPRDPIPQHA